VKQGAPVGLERIEIVNGHKRAKIRVEKSNIKIALNSLVISALRIRESGDGGSPIVQPEFPSSFGGDGIGIVGIGFANRIISEPEEVVLEDMELDLIRGGLDWVFYEFGCE
jgi:hypothetical protein